MRILTSPPEIAAAFDQLIERYQSISIAVAWASVNFPAYNSLLRHRDKIRRAVIGLHFYQTHPDFIKTFLNHPNVKYVKIPNGVFHPKLYLFESRRGDWSCLLGSANFTPGGFAANSEVMVLTDRSDDGDRSIKKALDNVIKTHWAEAEKFSATELPNYRQLFSKNRTKFDYGSQDTGAPSHQIPLLLMSWNEFSDKVQNERLHSLDGRLAVIQAARGLFAQYPSFNRIPLALRKNLAGYLRGDVDWGWFGSMRGAGIFKNRVNVGDPHLSAALDCIPLEGQVLRQHYDDYVDEYCAAFPNGRGHGLPTATRLLAMKRPDYFVCVDGKNEKRLADAFDIKVSRHDYAQYWGAIIQRIMDSIWWNEPRPLTSPGKEIWDGRAAFLDSLFYEE